MLHTSFLSPFSSLVSYSFICISMQREAYQRFGGNELIPWVQKLNSADVCWELGNLSNYNVTDAQSH